MNKIRKTNKPDTRTDATSGLFDMLPEFEQGTKVEKAAIDKPRHIKPLPRVRLCKPISGRQPGLKFIDGIHPRKMSLKVVLERVKPKVWRKMDVPSNISLEYLHTVIQTSFRWSNEHRHKFIVGKETVECGDDESGFDADYDSRLVAIDEVLPIEGCTIKYLYDFGANWLHTIFLEAVSDYSVFEEPGIHLTGRKGIPPEDG